MAGRTQTTRSANQDRTSTCAEYSFAQAPPSQIIFVVGRINESRRAAEWNEFLPNLPGNSGFTDSVDHDTLGKRPGQSHSIVSGALNHLKGNDFISARFNFAVMIAVRKFRLEPIDGDRCRKLADALEATRCEQGSRDQIRMLKTHFANFQTGQLVVSVSE